MNVLRVSAAVVAAISLGSCAGKSGRHLVLRCDDGTSLTVAYEVDRTSITVEDDETVRLVPTISASGARYVGEDREYWEKNGKVRWSVDGRLVKTCVVPPGSRDGDSARIANPASVHCAAVGGRPVTERLPDGSEIGVCLFTDNRQCGQWALFRGTCPVGGLRVTGYPTDAARRCAITGGRYAIAGTRETCTTPKGTVCDLETYDRGDCR